MTNAQNSDKKEMVPVSVDDPDDYADVFCGFGPIRPKFLQPLAKLPVFAGFVGIAGFLSSSLSVYISSQVTALERMFGFSSATSGFLMSCNDIGYLLCILFASYFARRTHIPRIMYLVTAGYGISGLLCCIPYFLTSEKFMLSKILSLTSSENVSMSSLKVDARLCVSNKTTLDSIGLNSCDTSRSGDGSASLFGLTEKETTTAVVIIAIGMLFQGFTKAPRSPFVATYVDDNSKKKTQSPSYIGLILGLTIFGPAVAFGVGGLFSRIYVTLEESDMNYRDPRWIGAWWLGFLMYGVASISFGTPLLFFPRHLLPKSQRLSVKETGEKQPLKLKDFKGFITALGRLLTNPIFFPLTLAMVLQNVTIAGSVSFNAKYVEKQFYVPAWKANIIMGGCSILAIAAGAIIGGQIISRRKLSAIGCTKMTIYCQLFHILLIISFLFLGCQQQDVRANWDVLGVKYGSMLSDTSCLSHCFCDTSTFRPVCDMQTGITYYSACHAGCSSTNGTIFHDCSCVPSGAVLSGYCPSTCTQLMPYIIVMFLSSFSGALTIMTYYTIIMRSVHEADKPLALGVNAFVINLCAWMPAPIIFGAIIDTTCLMWNKKCDRIGSCAMHDGQDFRYKFKGIIIALRVLSMLLLFVVLRNIMKADRCDEKKPTCDEKNNTNRGLCHLGAVNNSQNQREAKWSLENTRIDINNYEMEILLSEAGTGLDNREQRNNMRLFRHLRRWLYTAIQVKLLMEKNTFEPIY